MLDEGSRRRWSVQLRPYEICSLTTSSQEFAVIMGPVREELAGFTESDAEKPAVELSWFDAVEYCNRLSIESNLKECYSRNADNEVICDGMASGYRLPTEAEWEFACRAGTSGQRYGELDEIAWYRENSDSRRHAVGKKTPNALGLYDTIGNVWEWCWDIFDAKVYGSYRVFRGGGWYDPPRSCRASCRRKSHPTFRIDDLGFRVARSLLGSRTGRVRS